MPTRATCARITVLLSSMLLIAAALAAPTRALAQSKATITTADCDGSIGGVPLVTEGSDASGLTPLGGTRYLFDCSYRSKERVGGDGKPVQSPSGVPRLQMNVFVEWDEVVGGGCPAHRESFGGGTDDLDRQIPSATHQAVAFTSGTENGREEGATKNYRPQMEALARKLLAAVEAVAALCPVSSPSASASVTPTASGTCIPEGTVLDHRGRPVEGIQVALRNAGVETLMKTDSQGHYRFDPVSSGSISITVQTVDEGRFRITYDGKLGALTTDPFEKKAGQSCTRDFAAATIPQRYVSSDPGRERWADIVDVYQNVRTAMALADQLGVKPAATIDVHAWCKNASSVCPARLTEAGAEFGVVNVAGSAPFMALGDGASQIAAVNKPDNLEYHEFGHVMMTLAYGAFPNVKRTHGGYGEFDSAGSFLEGWADFYAAMVAKHIEKRPFPELYRQGGGYWNLETNYPPWGLGGTTEEYAVAGLLLDLEDGTADYATPRPEKQFSVQCCVSVANGTLVGGNVTYTQTATAPGSVPSGSEATVVMLTFSDGSSVVVPTDPSRLAPGQQGTFAAPLPAGANASATTAKVLEGRPGNILTDDDQVDLDLGALWSAIVGHTALDRRAGRHVVTIADLYDALAGFRGTDSDGDGMDDIDRLFVLHGLYADKNGNHSYDAGEQVGLTSHPQTDYYTGRPSRRNAPSLPETLATADTGGVPSRVQVQVRFAAPNEARSYGYTAARDPNGNVMLAFPPSGSGALVTLIAFADGYEPALLGTIEADQYWTDTEQHRGESFLAFQAAMVPAVATSPDAAFPIPVLLGIAVVLAAIVILVLRRRGRVAPAASGVCPTCGTPSTGTAFCLSCGARSGP